MVSGFLNELDQTTKLDAILAAIYLMVFYEQNLGDGDGTALSAHLKGLASIIQNEAKSSTAANIDPSASPTVVIPSEVGSSDKPLPLRSFTIFAIRILEWICFSDACASSFGLGGDFNATIHDLLKNAVPCRDSCSCAGDSDLLP